MPEVESRTYANPQRLPRRIHYQEGPGFLSVATQGGGRLTRRPGALKLRSCERRAALRPLRTDPRHDPEPAADGPESARPQGIPTACPAAGLARRLPDDCPSQTR